MLVLSRKKGDKIMIQDNIEVVVVEIRGDKIRLGVNAPIEIPVHRHEVYDAIKRNEGQGQSGESGTVTETDGSQECDLAEAKPALA